MPLYIIQQLYTFFIWRNIIKSHTCIENRILFMINTNYFNSKGVRNIQILNTYEDSTPNTVI